LGGEAPLLEVVRKWYSESMAASSRTESSVRYASTVSAEPPGPRRPKAGGGDYLEPTGGEGERKACGEPGIANIAN